VNKLLMQEINILSSDFRRKMEINDNNEQLVDLRDKCPDVAFEISDYLNHSSEVEDAHFVRKSIARMINTAQANLPAGLRLIIKCGYRTPEVQARQYRKDYENLRLEKPNWDKDKLDIEIVKRTDPPDVGPHCTGGAIDLSIIDESGKQLDMGTNMGVFNLDTYTYSDTIAAESKLNRNILIDTMSKAGFLNFPAEWWHWSYGDREWAFVNNQTAFYGPIDYRLDTENDNYVQEEIFSTASGAY